MMHGCRLVLFTISAGSLQVCWGSKPMSHPPMVMMALDIVYGHDLMTGSPPCHVHPEQRDVWAPDLCYLSEVLYYYKCVGGASL